MHPSRILLSMALLLAVNGCGGRAPDPQFDLAAVQRIIVEKNAAFTAAHVSGEVGVINDYFADGATIFAPGSVAVTGSAAIAELNEQYVAYGISEFSEETTAVYGTEEYVIEEGTYTMTYGPDHVRETGKYINIWQPQDGDWKVRANIWNDSPGGDAE